MKRAGVSLLILLMLLAVLSSTVFAAAPSGVITSYPVSGSPFHVAVQDTGRVWATLPAENKIARLEVSAPGVFTVQSYQLPTAASQPYDIVFAAGSVWVSEYAGNKIARFDPVQETWTEYVIPTSASKPTGLTVLQGEPIQVWFCEQAGNKLGRLTITAAEVSEFTEYPLPLAWAGANMESIAATSSDNVWFTAPGRSGIGQFTLAGWQINPANAFGFVSTNPPNLPNPPNPTRPYDIKIDGTGSPWITEPITNLIGRLNLQTMGNFEWYSVKTPGSGLRGLDLSLGFVWFAEQNSGRVGQLQKVGFSGIVRELPLPSTNSAPTDIAMGPNGCAWVSASGANALVSWCAPYFLALHLPLIQRN